MGKAMAAVRGPMGMLLALLVLGCATPAPRYATADVLRFDAQVTWVEMEGGFWGLVSADGTRFDPPALPRRFHRAGLKVHVMARPVDGLTSRMWGQPIRVMTIRALETPAREPEPAQAAAPTGSGEQDRPPPR